MRCETMVVLKSEVVKSVSGGFCEKEEAYLHHMNELLNQGWLILHITVEGHEQVVIKMGRPLASADK